MAPFAEATLNQDRPERVWEITLLRRQRYYPSPADWRDEDLYFLLVDRISDGQEASVRAVPVGAVGSPGQRHAGHAGCVREPPHPPPDTLFVMAALPSHGGCDG